MNKKIINDIIISPKSIRQIPLSREKKIEYKELKKEIRERKPMNPKLAIWLIAGVCVLALFFGISMLFSSATVTIVPKTENISFNNESFTAKAASTAPADLSFEVLSVKKTAGETVSASEEKEVSQKASGKIIIYNNYSAAPQRLINNTRFEAVNGKVYRINSSVVVPGLKKVDGKTVPGSIEAVVYADQPGDEYNMKVSDLTGDFKIPGFKGDVRYQGFYARLKSDITGGLVGRQRIVNAELRQATEEILKSRLKEQLLKELYADKPEDYIVFKDGYSVDFTDLPDTAVDASKVKINVEGSLNGIVFNNLKLTKYLAAKKLPGFDGLPAELIPADNLTVTFVGSDSTGLWKNGVLQVKFNGDAVIKWKYDSDALKKDLAGKKESEVPGLAAKYKNSVKSLEVVFRPVWTRYFPDNPDKIRIQEKI